VRALASLVVASALTLLVTLGGGCEAIVNGDVPAYTCSGTSLAACIKGTYCKGAGCVACEARDICDGYDNDCNGKLDDGPLSDHDGDGYTICGRQNPKTGQFENIDCDDGDGAVHPGAEEVCNGKDDDCDGIVDEPDRVCPQGQICQPTKQRCIDQTTACTVTGCTSPKTCDTNTEQCVDPPSTDLGGTCGTNTQCTSHICGDGSVLGVGFSQGSVCTSTCCTSADCRAGFVCFGAGTGGSYCVKSSALARPLPGGGLPGAGCNGGGDCRSGACGPTKKCLDTCCNDGQCTNGTSCTLNHDTPHAVYQCADSPGTRGQNSTCNGDADCKGGICYNYGDSTFPERHCISVCCGSASCGSVDFGFGVHYAAACYDVTSADVPSLGSNTVAVCVAPGQGVGSAPLGAPCNANGDCRSNRCHATAKKCTDVCCVDADCAPAGRGWACRPTAVGSGNDLRCAPVDGQTP
jgi:hypothetical protein